jgi:hypothetical protein
LAAIHHAARNIAGSVTQKRLRAVVPYRRVRYARAIMLRFTFALFIATILSGCPGPAPADGGDAGLDAPTTTNRGLVRWGSVACSASFDGGMGPADVCSHPSQHSSNTGINQSPDPSVFRCSATVSLADQTVVVGFVAHENHDTARWPGTIELHGAMGAATTPPTMIGQTVPTCEVRLTEGTHVAVGHCGSECVVTITNDYPEAGTGTVTGTIRCGAMADDSTPVVYRNVRQSDGVPGMAADFALNGCDPP